MQKSPACPTCTFVSPPLSRIWRGPSIRMIAPVSWRPHDPSQREPHKSGRSAESFLGGGRDCRVCEDYITVAIFEAGWLRSGRVFIEARDGSGPPPPRALAPRLRPRSCGDDQPAGRYTSWRHLPGSTSKDTIGGTTYSIRRGHQDRRGPASGRSRRALASLYLIQTPC